MIDVVAANEYPVETGFELFKAFKGNTKGISGQFYDAMVRAASVGKKMDSNVDIAKGIFYYLTKFGCNDAFVGWKYNDGSAWCCFPTGGDGTVMLVDLAAGTYTKTQFPDADFQEPDNGAVLVAIVVPASPPPAATQQQEEAKQPKQKRMKKDNAAAAAAAAATEAGEVVEVK